MNKVKGTIGKRLLRVLEVLCLVLYVGTVGGSVFAYTGTPAETPAIVGAAILGFGPYLIVVMMSYIFTGRFSHLRAY